MKKNAIKKAVEKAKGKHLKEAIDSVARSAAYDEVQQALAPPPRDAAKDEPVPTERAPNPSDTQPTYQVFQPGDPRLSRC